jgi:hypothetical protein
MTEEHLRMSDAEREQAATELGEHYAQGRLTAEEHAERLDQVWSSRTRGELTPVFRDLPGTSYGPAYAAAPAARRTPTTGRGFWSAGRVGPWRRGLPTPFLLVLAVLLVLTVLTHLPLLLVGLLVWFFVIARHRNRVHTRR